MSTRSKVVATIPLRQHRGRRRGRQDPGVATARRADRAPRSSSASAGSGQHQAARAGAVVVGQPPTPGSGAGARAVTCLGHGARRGPVRRRSPGLPRCRQATCRSRGSSTACRSAATRPCRRRRRGTPQRALAGDGSRRSTLAAGDAEDAERPAVVGRRARGHERRASPRTAASRHRRSPRRRALSDHGRDRGHGPQRARRPRRRRPPPTVGGRRQASSTRPRR